MIYSKLPAMSSCEPPAPDPEETEPLWTPPQFTLGGLFFFTTFAAILAAVMFTPGWTTLFVLDFLVAGYLLAQLLRVRRIGGIRVRCLTWVEWLVVFIVLGMLHAMKVPAVVSHPHRSPPAAAAGLAPLDTNGQTRGGLRSAAEQRGQNR